MCLGGCRIILGPKVSKKLLTDTVQQTHRPVYRNSIHLQRTDNPSRTQISGQLTTDGSICCQASRTVASALPSAVRCPPLAGHPQRHTQRRTLTWMGVTVLSQRGSKVRYARCCAGCGRLLYPGGVGANTVCVASRH